MSLAADDVRRLAAAQKLLLAALAIYLGAIGSSWSVALWIEHLRLPGSVRVPAMLFATGISLVAYFFQLGVGLRMCLLLSDSGWRVTGYVLAQCFPCMPLIALLILNQEAIQSLRASGIRVGWFGANAQDVADYHRPSDEPCPFCEEPLESLVRICPICGGNISELRGAELRKWYKLERTAKPPESTQDNADD